MPATCGSVAPGVVDAGLFADFVLAHAVPTIVSNAMTNVIFLDPRMGKNCTPCASTPPVA
jgi:hypothetical protein